jgi:predicted Zn-dependent protease
VLIESLLRIEVRAVCRHARCFGLRETLVVRKEDPMRHPLIPIALALALACGCSTVTNPVSGRPERTVMDEATEVETGRQQHQEVLKEYGAVSDTRLQAYVSEIGHRLAQHSERANLDWHFTVLDSPEVNAFALPGGYIYVTRGIMAYMNSEADLAGVMGHEIGHVNARHSAQRATREQAAGVGVLAATVLGAILEGRGVSGAGQLANEISQTAAAGYIAHYSREQESQADRLGADYLQRAGYDPQHMVRVIQLLKDQDAFAAEAARAEGRSPRQGPTWLASHPASEQRLSDIQAVVAQYHGSYGDEGRRRYLQAIDGLAFGETREQGVTRGRNFYHETLGFALTAPAGWQIQNESSALSIVSPSGDAGLVMQTAPAGSPDEILRSAGADQGSTSHYSINGMAATHYSGTRRDDQGRSQPLEATVVGGPGGHNVVFVYSATDASALRNAYGGLRDTEASFRPLSAADRAAARPWTLRLVPLPRGGFAELARSTPVPHAVSQLRLLNGAYSGAEPPPGTMVKTVS